jgi:GxxExxY protein
MNVTLHEHITHRIIGAAMRVYNTLGSGFNEQIYDKAMAVALQGADLSFESQKPVEIFFEGTTVGLYYLDYLVESCIVVELKAISELNNHHLAQAVTYLKATSCPIALLINFGTDKLQWKRVLPPYRIQPPNSQGRARPQQ